MASTASPERCDDSFIDSLMWRESGRCTKKPTIITIGMMVSGIKASLPPIIAITVTNSSKNGKSTKVSKLALVINSRTASNSRKLLA